MFCHFILLVLGRSVSPIICGRIIGLKLQFIIILLYYQLLHHFFISSLVPQLFLSLPRFTLHLPYLQLLPSRLLQQVLILYHAVSPLHFLTLFLLLLLYWTIMLDLYILRSIPQRKFLRVFENGGQIPEKLLQRSVSMQCGAHTLTEPCTVLIMEARIRPRPEVAALPEQSRRKSIVSLLFFHAPGNFKIIIACYS